VADLFALPFASASFDVVFAHAVLMRVGDRLAALREFHRILRPGGIVAVKDIKTSEQILEPNTPESRPRTPGYRDEGHLFAAELIPTAGTR
jgi:ubiquinone/menaquinone biosynthesis C-methylase UbiE